MSSLLPWLSTAVTSKAVFLTILHPRVGSHYGWATPCVPSLLHPWAIMCPWMRQQMLTQCHHTFSPLITGCSKKTLQILVISRPQLQNSQMAVCAPWTLIYVHNFQNMSFISPHSSSYICSWIRNLCPNFILLVKLQWPSAAWWFLLVPHHCMRAMWRGMNIGDTNYKFMDLEIKCTFRVHESMWHKLQVFLWGHKLQVYVSRNAPFEFMDLSDTLLQVDGPQVFFSPF